MHFRDGIVPWSFQLNMYRIVSVTIKNNKIPPSIHSLRVRVLSMKRLFATNKRDTPIRSVSVIPGKLNSGLVALKTVVKSAILKTIELPQIND